MAKTPRKHSYFSHLTHPLYSMDSSFFSAIYVILINIVTDMAPYFSILEIKFIEIFSVSALSIKKRGFSGIGAH